MLRWPYRVGQSFHCLETNVSAGMGTASKETRGLYREGYSDGASRVTGLGSLLDLPEALGANHDGKAPVPVDHPDPSPDHLRPARRTDKVLPEPEGRSSSTPTSASPCSIRTGNRGRLLSLDVHQDPASSLAPRQTTNLFSSQLFTPILYIVGKQEVRRKTARSQEDQECLLTAHKAVLITFEPSTKVLYSPCLLFLGLR